MSVDANIECPSGVRDALCEILYMALIAMRGAGNAGLADYCALEASHVHNLPSLLQRFDVAKLSRYLDMQVPWYLRELSKFPQSNPEAFAPQWQVLRDFRASLVAP